MNYALPSIKLNYGVYITPFEPFYWEILKLPIEDHVAEKAKTEIKKEAYCRLTIITFGMSSISGKKSI